MSEKTEPKEKPIFEFKTPEELSNTLFNIMCAIRGIDPNQVQGMAKFMDPDSVDETTYFPNQYTSVAIAQLRLYGEAFYKGEDWNEYEFAADILGIGFKGYKGFKSEQYKDITSGQPNLDKLQGLPEETKKGILSGIFGRGKSE
jgi:hypothetical protein